MAGSAASGHSPLGVRTSGSGRYLPKAEPTNGGSRGVFRSPEAAAQHGQRMDTLMQMNLDEDHRDDLPYVW
jgi:hypothetical protein